MTERSGLMSLLTFVVSSALLQRSQSDAIDLAHIENDAKWGLSCLFGTERSQEIWFTGLLALTSCPLCVCVCVCLVTTVSSS